MIVLLIASTSYFIAVADLNIIRMPFLEFGLLLKINSKILIAVIFVSVRHFFCLLYYSLHLAANSVDIDQWVLG